MKTILVVDDEKDIIELLKYNFQKEGYKVRTALNGKEALTEARQQPDLIILDIMMPEFDGREVIKHLKKDSKTSQIPIIFLTAKGTEADEVLGLELGADDYIVKPISIPKLLARVRNVFRKREEKISPENVIHIGAIEISLAQHTVHINKKEIFFPKKEFEVLFYLASHVDQVVTRETLLNNIWGSDVQVVDRTVDVHIRKIREKLGKHADCIETIKGVGYRLRKTE
ncbi:MAG: response regulator transcription factor [Ignavibacteriales bacterium]|nr:response regulator transcription factor [Ignavibacteriales bacterium]